VIAVLDRWRSWLVALAVVVAVVLLSVEGGWGWKGWSALVAIGTLALAGATFLLGREAQRQGEAATRPDVLVHVTDEWATGTGRYAGRAKAVLPLVNAGPGVAINVRGVLRWATVRYGARSVFTASNMAPGATIDVRLEHEALAEWEGQNGAIFYSDLSGHEWYNQFWFESWFGQLFARQDAPARIIPGSSVDYDRGMVYGRSFTPRWWRQAWWRAMHRLRQARARWRSEASGHEE
jgi:hypothetical protein